MKKWILVPLVWCLASQVWSRPVDLSAPSVELGSANSKGNLEIWREIEGAGIDLGKGSYLPLRYRFSSEDARGSILGAGFYAPMFEARNILIREDTMRVYLPCGKGLYLWKDTSDPSKFQTPDKEWTGVLQRDDFTVSREDGWVIVYHKGRLSSITTDEQHVFNWDYDGNTGIATRIKEDGADIVTVEPNQQGLVDAIRINGKRYQLEYAPRPIPGIISGQAVIQQLAIALSIFKYPDGRTEAYKFSTTPDLVPLLLLTDVAKRQTAYTWDVTNRHIATEKGPEGDWTYHIGDVTTPFGFPSITRVNSQGQSEGMTVNNQMGTYTAQGVDGVKTITHVFETPGPLYHKVQKIEEIRGKTTTLVYRASYNEAGELIREMDENGYITLFNYDNQGKLKSRSVRITQDSQVLAELYKEEKSMLASVDRAKTRDLKGDALRSLAQFYLLQMKDPAKAFTIVSQLDHKRAYPVRMQFISSDKALTLTDQLEGYAALLKDYPEYRDQIDFLINLTKKRRENE